MSPTPSPMRYAAFDLLATPVAVVNAQGRVRAVNAALEDTLGQSRRSLLGQDLATLCADPRPMWAALQGLRDGQFAALRYEAQLRRAHHNEALPVHVILAPTDQPDEVVVELLPIEQQTRQEREERLLEQSRANKELIRNLAHEIKNPLGGIRGAAQLLELELTNPELTEYTQVIVHEG